MKLRLAATGAAVLLALAGGAGAYPLDGFPATGIQRLEAYRLAAQGASRPDFLTEGEMLPGDAIRLGLVDRPGFRVPAPDPELSERLGEMLGGDAPSYGITVLDWTDPARPRYAALNPDRIQNPGSVGKIMLLLAWFQALADRHPDDVDARQRLLLETQVTADRFIRVDEHKVPIWEWGMSSVERRPIEEGDRANLWTFLDWTASASSNAAASTLMEQLVLFRHFGPDYPVPKAQADAFLRDTPKKQLSKIYLDAMLAPARQNGIDVSKLRQGAFFTREGKNSIPGTNSVSTASELLNYLVLMEQGRLVDEWSSLQIKRLLYLTDKRIRYAAQPALDPAAVYFKSGSLYGCKPERGFTCTKFHGNRINFMNSVVVVETPGRSPALRYAVVVLSNVLRRDSSALHEELAERIHRILERLHPEGSAALPTDWRTTVSSGE